MYVLFKTVHGSRLYGLSHAGSDEDYYTVVSKVKTKKAKYSTHKIVGDTDSVVVDLGTWLRYCEMGVPQALEAMFSQMAEVDRLGPLRAQYRAGTRTWDRYLRTIKSFALTEETDEYKAFKQRRHALRLAFNFRDLREYGRFNPTLTEYQKLFLDNFSNYDGDTVYYNALVLAWS